MVTITIDRGQAILHSPYDAALVAQLKAAIPYQMRSWDKGNKVWRFHQHYMTTVARICKTIFGVSVELPTRTDRPEIAFIRLEYLGNSKDRGGNEPTSLGWCDGGWNAVFPERVLREWFLRDPDPMAATTLYAVIGVPRDASKQEIKQAYRQAARTHHPDVGGNRDLFERVQEAWEVLSSSGRRAMYDSGLVIAASLPDRFKQEAVVTWKPPVRCGVVMAKCHKSQGGKMLIAQILEWQDIVEDGKALLTFWKYGDDKFTEVWRRI